MPSSRNTWTNKEMLATFEARRARAGCRAAARRPGCLMQERPAGLTYAIWMDGSGRNRLYFGSDAGGRANRMRRITTLFAGALLLRSRCSALRRRRRLKTDTAPYQRGDCIAALRLRAFARPIREIRPRRRVLRPHVRRKAGVCRRATVAGPSLVSAGPPGAGFAPAQRASGPQCPYFGHRVPQDSPAARPSRFGRPLTNSGLPGSRGLGSAHANGVIGVPQAAASAGIWFDLVAPAIGPSASSKADAVERAAPDHVAADMNTGSDCRSFRRSAPAEWKPVRESDSRVARYGLAPRSCAPQYDRPCASSSSTATSPDAEGPAWLLAQTTAKGTAGRHVATRSPCDPSSDP